jgi:hypothetical protein
VIADKKALAAGVTFRNMSDVQESHHLRSNDILQEVGNGRPSLSGDIVAGVGEITKSDSCYKKLHPGMVSTRGQSYDLGWGYARSFVATVNSRREPTVHRQRCI